MDRQTGLSQPESEGRWVAIYSGHRLHRGVLETRERRIAGTVGPLLPVPIAVLALGSTCVLLHCCIFSTCRVLHGREFPGVHLFTTHGGPQPLSMGRIRLPQLPSVQHCPSHLKPKLYFESED